MPRSALKQRAVTKRVSIGQGLGDVAGSDTAVQKKAALHCDTALLLSIFCIVNLFWCFVLRVPYLYITGR